MDQKWIRMLVILVFYQQITPGSAEDKMVEEGRSVDIKCNPGKGTMVVWLRVLGQSDIDFIASFSSTGQIKSPGSHYSSFTHRSPNNNEYVLTLKSFKRDDSGIYICGALVNGNKLEFGEVTRLYGEKKEEATVATPACTTIPTPSTTTTSCVCNTKPGVYAGPRLSLFCAPIILGPLAGGCGLLLLLLIVVTIYCNKMRTRRCPHHYKRKPRTGVPGKMMTNI